MSTTELIVVAVVLAARQERHDHLDIRPLDPQLRRRYAEQWRVTQARFVDEPSAAFEEADRLLEDVMVERGYPVGDFNQQMDRPVRRPQQRPHPLPAGPSDRAGVGCRPRHD
jgi:hypothetical protein